MKDLALLEQKAQNLRLDIVEMCYRLKENAAHLGGCLSIAELMAVLYVKILNCNKDDLCDEKRDRVIMSKGHASIAMYAGMHQAGLIKSLDHVGNLLGKDNIYYKQEVRNVQKGIEFSSGSLGQGLAYGIGIAMALKSKGNFISKVYIFVGDGECNEGSIWEAAAIAGHFKLNNLVVVIDKNGLQIDGETKRINSQENMSQRWKSFGFQATEIDGHNLSEVEKAYKTVHSGGPLAIVAHTVKGKGVSFAEGQAEWHQNILTERLYKIAISDLRRGR